MKSSEYLYKAAKLSGKHPVELHEMVMTMAADILKQINSFEDERRSKGDYTDDEFGEMGI